MSTPDSTPFTDAPFALQALWNKFTLRGELDPHFPPATVREAYNQVVAVHLKEMRETVEAIETDIRNAETDMLASAGPPDQATCLRCGARHLEHFYTSKQGGSTLCPGCFQRRIECGRATEKTE
ncbi:hypothetical protein MYX04_12715 [Nitrospiraceae bacterium AH_259_D15_M11_P09]|nr:hypothetical protein [Nitrospiraceae bacterium AH_259_D15_M11_P09]